MTRSTFQANESVYPAMSHPSADPARNFVAARLAGLEVKDPACARILEIGCAGGHHLVPLARRWSESEFVGIDASELAIKGARESAAVANLQNVAFHHAAVTDFEPEDGGFDYIIAHGFFSWVKDETKAALIDFIQRHLAPKGVAVVSFNVAAGWRKRLPVIVKTRAIMEASGVDVMRALEIMADVIEDQSERAIVADMLAKGPEVLAFDDFAPVNDAWGLIDFAAFCAERGLCWLGGSEVGKSVALPIDLLDSWDEEQGTAFRSELVCRGDAPISEKVPASSVLQFAAGLGAALPVLDDDGATVARWIGSKSPSVVPLMDVVEEVDGMDIRKIVGVLYGGIIDGWIVPRSEAVRLYEIAPTRPALDVWHRWCLEQGYPLVDALHRPCVFPEMQRRILSLMDGTRSLEELTALAKVHTPLLDFEKWSAHVAGRGLFS